MINEEPAHGRPHLSVIRLSMPEEQRMGNHDSPLVNMAPFFSPYEREDSRSSMSPADMKNSAPPAAVPMQTSSEREKTYRAAPDINPLDRQLSIIDPYSDRVTSILVWKNLTVLTREDKVVECFQRIKCWRKFKPKRLCLLNNISGAITGGLWAVMGTCSTVTCVHTR